MREAVKARGMENLVADSGEAAIGQLERQIQGEDSIDTFDPLMHMHWAILANLPPRIFFMDGCPLCNADRLHKEECPGPPCQITDFEWMVDRSADDALDKWKELTRQ